MSELQQLKRSSKVSFQEPPLPKSSVIIWIIGIGLLVLLTWAWLFKLEEVSTGTGKIIPSSKEQVIQSLDGGILTKLNVKEGEIVERGQVLAQLDPTRFESNVGESESLLVSSRATSARLRAEVTGAPLVFPEEVLRLKREANDLRNQMNDIRNQYYVNAREELSKANTDVETQQQVVRGKSDTLSRTVFKSPVRGVVKEIDVMTLGGVIPQNGKLMTIVPLDEKLLVEARISPRDIAFIRPDQEALVKITAYDYSIYGGLNGKVAMISPDTLRDEVKQDQFYYRVYIRTDSDKLSNNAGQEFNITPGMVATADIRTGSKTVMDYLIKPFNKAKEALRER